MTQFWHVAEALLALYRHRCNVKRPTNALFTRSDLVKWSERFQGRPRAAMSALIHMEKVGFARRVAGTPPGEAPARQGVLRFALTSEGLAAAKAAHEARARSVRCAAAAQARQSQPRDRHSFLQRLWSLLRMRRALTGPEAAATLLDAGQDIARASKTASDYLRRWSELHPDAIKTSVQRVDGACRYVLLSDLGPDAPIVAIKKKTRGGVAA
jgi:hypothetical protein